MLLMNIQEIICFGISGSDGYLVTRLRPTNKKALAGHPSRHPAGSDFMSTSCI